MNKSLELLLNNIKDQKLDISEKFNQCKTPKEAYDIALTISDGYSFEEFRDLMKEFASFQKKDELTDEDLSYVAGGMSNDYSDVFSYWKSFDNLMTQEKIKRGSGRGESMKQFRSDFFNFTRNINW